jgi:hypothetical protein
MRRGVLKSGNSVLRHLGVPAFALLFGIGGAFAQSGDLRAQDQSQKPANSTPADTSKDNQRKTDEFVEAQQAINGPAGNPECVWLGRRVVVLMWRDDLDTAFRHLDLYDRFGCPSGHIQASFRCLLLQHADSIDPKADPKAADNRSGRVQSCWLNPTQQAAAPAPAPAPAAAVPSPTTNR